MVDVTGTVTEDGALVIKGEGGAETRYVKEADLLAVKGSRVSKEDVTRQVEEAKAAATQEAENKLASAEQRALQAEARVSSLQEQVTRGGGSAAELERAKADLETAKSSSEGLSNKLLELRKDFIVKSYGVKREVVDTKDLAGLEVFEEVLKVVVGDKNIGNFAIGGGTGGGNPLAGKSPLDLARDAYASSNK